MSWTSRAICHQSDNRKYWLSYDVHEISHALDGCSICKVKKQCAESYADVDYFVGVVAGTTEFDRLMSKWKKVVDVNDDNWS